MTYMSMNRFKELVTQIILVVSLLFGVVALTGTTAQAQGQLRFDRHRGGVRSRVFIYPQIYSSRWYWHDSWYNQTYPYYYQSYYIPSTHVTEGQGYRDGLDDGKDDAEEGKAYNPHHHNDYKNAETSAYTSGYLQGYAEGYHQVAD
jgi:hypothetical protein